MAGTIPLSLTQQFDIYGQPLAGGQLYLIQAGTVSTPQDGFQDTNLTIKMPYPITLDAAGRIPQFFLADGTIKVRLQDKNGVVQLAADSILVIGPSAGSGGGSTVDPTQLIQTGNMILRYGVGVIAGYVRLNGLTIGSATSGATERANLDCQNLFQYLWGVDVNLVVGGGRGANAAADWGANKAIALPDWRGYSFGCLDDMGNTPAGRLTLAYFSLVRPPNDASSSLSPIALGGVGGSESRLLTGAQCAIPAHQHNVYLHDPTHTHAYGGGGGQAYNTSGNSGGTAPATPAASSLGPNINPASTGLTIGSVPGVANDNLTASTSLAASQAHAAIGPRKLCTGYIKL